MEPEGENEEADQHADQERAKLALKLSKRLLNLLKLVLNLLSL